MIKKILSTILLGLVLVPLIAMPIASAADTEEPAFTVEYDIPKPDFLPGPSDTIDPGSNAHEYVLNKTIPRVMNIVLGILGIGAFIGILFAAFNMLTAYGNEEKVNKGKTILTYSLIGFAVSLLAYAIISVVVSVALPQEEEVSWFIPKAYAESSLDQKVDALFPSQETLIEDHDDQNRISLPSGDLLTEIVPAIITNIFYMIGFLIFAGLMYGGVLMIAGRGNEEMNTKAKNIIIWSGIALVLVATGYALIYGIASLDLGEDPTTENDNIYTETVVE
jgi:hypothetical protein